MSKRALALNNPASQGLQALFREHEQAKEKRRKAQAVNSLDDLKSLLRETGEKWREEHKETQKKNGQEVEIIHRVPARLIANILEKVVKFAVIGDNEKDIDTAPLTFYNPTTGLYTRSERLINNLILSVDNTTNKRARSDIREWLRIEAPARSIEKNINLVPVGNGIYNKDTKELMQFNSKYVFTSKVATDYIKENIQEPNFNGWNFTKWLDELADGSKEKRTLLWQLVASVIQNKRTSNVLFCLIDNGQGRTGKSTFEQLLMNLVGKGNYTALKLEEFDHPFLLAQAYGASLIIGDDNDPRGYIDNGSTLKSIATNELVLINPKGQQPFSAKFYCTIVQSMNGFPRFKDTTGGLYRRFRLIKFNHQYPDTASGRLVKDRYIKNEQLLRWILKKALTINIDTITNTAESQAAVDELQLENDTVLSFVKEVVPDLESSRMPISLLFAIYRKYTDDSNNSNRMTRATFTRRIRPLMIERGWTYRVAKPGRYMIEEDIERLKGEKLYNYNSYRKNDHKAQRCFIKQELHQLH